MARMATRTSTTNSGVTHFGTVMGELLDRRARRISLVNEKPLGPRSYAANNLVAVVSSS
jgi:hypothetical protein